METESFLAAVWYVFTSQVIETLRADPLAVALKLLPFVLFLELPVYLLVFAGIMRFAYERRTAAPPEAFAASTVTASMPRMPAKSATSAPK